MAKVEWTYVAYSTHAVKGYPYHAIRRVPLGDRPVGRVSREEDARRVDVRAPRAGTHRDRPEPEIAETLVWSGLPVEVADRMVRMWRWGVHRIDREGLLRWLERQGHAGYGHALELAVAGVTGATLRG